MSSNNSKALQTLAQHLGVTLPLNSHDSADFFKDEHQIILSGAADQHIMTWFAEVEEPGSLDNLEVLKFLLKANYGGHGTKSASFCLDPVSGALLLHQRVDVSGLSDEQLTHAMDEFCEQTVFWNTNLEDLIARFVTSPQADDATLSAAEYIKV